MISLISIRREIGAFGLRSIVAPSLRAFGFGILGSAVGWVVLHVLTFVLGEPNGTLMGILFVAGAGIPAIVASFGVAYMMGVSESPFFDGIFRRISRLLKRA